MKTRIYVLGAAAAVMGVAVVVAAVPLLLPKPAPAAQVGSGAASALTVELTAPRQEQWPQTIATNGVLAAWQEVIVAPETGGYRIAELHVDVGAHVKAGQLLARLADDSLKVDARKQQAAVDQAQANLEQASSNLKRARQIESSGALSAQKIEEYRITEATNRAALASAQADLDSTRLKLAQTRIVAPDDGVVSSKSAILGNVVSAGTEMYRLVRKGRVEWHAELNPQQLAMIHEKDVAEITLPDGRKVPGKVRIVAPTFSTSTGRGLVYVSLPEADGVRPGVFADGVIELAAKPALTLPQAAVIMRDGRSYIYTVGKGDLVSSLRVDTGRSRNARVEITSALNPQLMVVAAGGEFLSDGSKVSVVNREAAKGQAKEAAQ